jgi:hypothetical protein
MKLIIKLVILAVLIALIGGVYIWKTTDWQSPTPKSALLVHTYISNPGFVTPDYRAEFERTKPECLGYKRVLNEDSLIADGPELSLCIGILK